MQYFIIFVIAIIFIFFVLNYLRKLHWDAVHHNLLDLVDDIGGKILRQGMFSRPVFHGKYRGEDITINFSQEKSGAKRKSYMDISIGHAFKNSITISSLAWIEERNESTKNFDEFLSQERYGILLQNKTAQLNKNTKAKLAELSKKLIPFNYLFIGNTGLIFEKECENIAHCTRHEHLKATLSGLIELCKTLN